MAYEPKTKPTGDSVAEFLAGVEPAEKRADAEALCDLMAGATGEPPKMWGKSIVGFGSYHYRYPSGQEADWLATGFSPRKQNLTVYVMPGFDEYETLLEKLGPHSTGKSCLYLKRLSDVDTGVLKQLVQKSYRAIKKQYPA